MNLDAVNVILCFSVLDWYLILFLTGNSKLVIVNCELIVNMLLTRCSVLCPLPMGGSYIVHAVYE